jgi:hypothetical protein
MKTKTHIRGLTAVLIVCIVITIAHFLYAANAYQHASIIYFIAKELW